MRFLADESLDFRVVTALRGAGYDVAAVLEEARGWPDPEVLALAQRTERILLTEDKDFGQLATVTEGPAIPGVLLVRCPESARAGLPGTLVALIALLGERLRGAIVVWTPRRVRIRRL
ncbi:MAG TPA: DUF5615 family PIN-like protein [Thermoanaerobaculia bacterium]|nr:DUF5615 family PIN-like protein [Thermoanaerobaculia bacterium]